MRTSVDTLHGLQSRLQLPLTLSVAFAFAPIGEKQWVSPQTTGFT